jgi:mono/diheme cytochrome c family protein
MKSLSSTTQVVLGVLTVALAVVVIVFAVSGDDSEPAAPTAGGASDPQADPQAVATFQDTCGTCHTLSVAGTDGDVGPVLDDYAFDRERVLTTIENGVDNQMPAGLLEGKDAEAVADLIAGDEPTTANPSEAADQDGPDS